MAVTLTKLARTLTLTSGEFMRGLDVRVVQTLVSARTHRPIRIDGEYGPATAAAVAWWKRYHAGYPEAWLSDGKAGRIADKGYQHLLGRTKPPVTWLARAALRRRKLPPPSVRDAAVQHALRYRGVTESPAGSNIVPALRDQATTLGVIKWVTRMGYPWCAFFGHLMALAAGSQTAAAGLRRDEFNALYTVAILEAASAGRHGMTIVGTSEAGPGDHALINFPGGDPRCDHLAILTSPVRPDGSYDTIEGNTSSGDGGSQSNGGGVFARTRSTTITRAFIRLDNPN